MPSRIAHRKVTMKQWQLAMLKIGMITVGILLGLYFAEFWRPLERALWILFAVVALWAGYTLVSAARRARTAA